MEPVIRTAAAEDAAALLNIYAWYVEHTAITFEYTVPSPAEFRRRISRTLEAYPWLCAEQDGKLLGYAYAGPFAERAAYGWAAEVSIYLAREARGQGLGRRLYEALEACLKAMGVLNLYAKAAYPQADDEYLTRNSVEFHRHLGYRTAGEYIACGCKFGRWYNLACMEKCIGAHRENPAPVRPYSEVKRPE
ncbi:MAG: N-acetyltransferase [Oscillibacter sp.]|nr:GNAT family N-acetyltransferase [uncultured Oscillibacter sp.]MCI8971408.1 N-acetyltransferase [Oscillibacter sp.]